MLSKLSIAPPSRRMEDPQKSAFMKDTEQKTNRRSSLASVIGRLLLLAQVFLAVSLCSAQTRPGIPSIFKPESTPADSIYGLSLLVLGIVGFIFAFVVGLLVYLILKFRRRANDNSEPPQVYGSSQIELAWTVIPVLIVLVLFMATARVIHAIQDAPKPAGAVDVTVIGHQFWWAGYSSALRPV